MSKYHRPSLEPGQDARELKKAIDILKSQVDDLCEYNDHILTSSHRELQAIMTDYRDDKIEDIAMTLEFLRRNMPKWNEELETYLFTEADLLEIKNKKTSNEENRMQDIGIGDLK